MKHLRRSSLWILAAAVTTVALIAAIVLIKQGPTLFETTDHGQGTKDSRPRTTDNGPRTAERADEILTLARAKSARRQWDLIDTVEEIGDTLTKEEAAEILQKLREIAETPNLRKVSAVNLNSLLNLLRQSGYADPEIFQSLAGIVANEAAEAEVRDYALQHAEGWLRERDPVTGGPAVEEKASRGAIHQLLVDAAARPGESFSGTAATALVDLAAFDPQEFDTELVDESVLRLLRSEEAHPAAQVSAIQLCAERGLIEALPDIRAVAANADATPAMRLAAYGALGAMGDASDADAMDKLLATRSRDPRYDAALQGARKRIAARMAAATDSHATPNQPGK